MIFHPDGENYKVTLTIWKAWHSEAVPGPWPQKFCAAPGMTQRECSGDLRELVLHYLLVGAIEFPTGYHAKLWERCNVQIFASSKLPKMRYHDVICSNCVSESLVCILDRCSRRRHFLLPISLSVNSKSHQGEGMDDDSHHPSTQTSFHLTGLLKHPVSLKHSGFLHQSLTRV